MCDKLGGVAIAVQGALFEHNERRQLGDGAFIDIRSGWLTGGEELLDALLSTCRGEPSAVRCTTGWSMCRGW